ncbi:hypothetical protein BDZ89DRAFT_1081717 [Hymenopellis radicata]|nr:hypothetical protein BDZ89DRAFT_1081717 [Hymenopellis radicata]
MSDIQTPPVPESVETPHICCPAVPTLIAPKTDKYLTVLVVPVRPTEDRISQ